jgi:hypothetical protein
MVGNPVKGVAVQKKLRTGPELFAENSKARMPNAIQLMATLEKMQWICDMY